MKSLFRLAVLISIALFTWYVVADRVTPFTSNARVKAVVMPIVPQVSGSVSAIAVSNSQLVDAGDVLAVIDQRPFQLALDQARAELDIASQEVGASSAGVEIAQANLAKAQSKLENARVQSTRIFELEKKGLVPVARADDTRANLAAAESNLAAAQGDLQRAKEQLGREGGDNPRIQGAVARLGAAELDLEWATLRAPSLGAIINLDIEEGAYANAGQPLMTFVARDNVWIEAYMTENNLGNISIGDRAEVVLDMHPGRILEGVVASFGGAASVGRRTRAGDLPSVPSTSGWMREPQRFALIIRLPGYETGDATDDVRFQVNGQADVIVYTGDNAALNALGRAWIRASSWISYVY